MPNITKAVTLSKYIPLFIIGFMILILTSLIWNIHNINQQILQLATQEAKTNLNKDLAFRLWATRHGGAYLTVDENTKPIPFLANIKDRDVNISSGKMLTLYNPATMLREIMNDYGKLYGVKARITAKVYMNPENAPDTWESKALDILSSGKKEYTEIIQVDGKRYLRMMQPMYMEQGCIKCHAWTGIPVGGLRGATDVTIPLDSYKLIERDSISNLILTHLILWIIGIGMILFLGRRLIGSEKAFETSRQRLLMLTHALEQSGNGIIITNTQGIIEYVNKAFSKINGYTRQELIGKKPNVMRTHLNSSEIYKNMWETISKGFTWRGEFKNQKKNGAIYWCLETISPVLDNDGKITHYIGVIEDIEDRKHTEEHLQQLILFDPLTKLPNRHFFRERLNTQILEAQENDKIFGLIYIDLDRFKMVNDSLGHSVGDQLLQNLADRFAQICDENRFCVRLGGDEFAIITEFSDSKESIEKSVHDILHLMKEPFFIDQNDIYMTASIGIALYPQDGDDAETLIKAADMAMYGAKIKGKNTYLFFEPTNGDFVSGTLIIENALRKAIGSDELFLVYQPKYNTREKQFIGLEVLIRWNSPTLGFMNPAYFIPIAEETDLIITLGEWILKEALSKMMKLSETTGFIPKISVNLSPVQFRNQHLNEIITKALQETGFPFEKLELEITEGALVDNPTLAIEKMNQLTVHGITFSIDDFGTGYSSMSYLKKFPVSTLKIDKSFVDDLVTDPHDRAIVQAIITMATSLGIKTIAEGAETIEQVTILNDLECFAIQGYWHSRPLTYTDLLNYFETNTL
ncbi:MAG: EAL domain-containing protein [Sulfuricurvum sp.]|uniref:EAL domain-containing protein n=1 Tax=Sulfuricurvum sp. TaxID=2025608 RepID=UPI002623AB5E|nr:EAL domain-containing protein [Sulfuricurvum sp.]MDD5117820.1 EAL domain-containing protein [Sulfuricurvum sp.]